MKVGSIVVVVLPINVDPAYLSIIKWLPVQDSKTPYMIRSIGDFPDGTAATLEEGCIGMTPMGEVHLLTECLREILPPDDIAEQVEDMMCVPMNEEL